MEQRGFPEVIIGNHEGSVSGMSRGTRHADVLVEGSGKVRLKQLERRFRNSDAAPRPQACEKHVSLGGLAASMVAAKPMNRLNKAIR